MKDFHIHLVSDSTGETVGVVARASLVQFEKTHTTEHLWTMVRNKSQVKNVLQGIKANPGFVLYTLVNSKIRDELEAGCRELGVPCVSVLKPIVAALGIHLGAETQARPGGQHVLDAEYYQRIDAMHFVLNHDDGHSTWDLDEADVILLGVSRTSKTPTCIYLANRGIKAANVPIVPGFSLQAEVLEARRPLLVGLTVDAKQLVQIRRNRLRLLNEVEETDYVDLETVVNEVKAARRLFSRHGWIVIDVTRKSIEEIAATIINHCNRRKEELSWPA